MMNWLRIREKVPTWCAVLVLVAVVVVAFWVSHSGKLPDPSKEALASNEEVDVIPPVALVVVAPTTQDATLAEPVYLGAFALSTFYGTMSAHETQNYTKFFGDFDEEGQFRSQGWLHQSEKMWQEGCEAGGVNWAWSESHNCDKAYYVEYWWARKWEPLAVDDLTFSVLAKLHNGGPEWRRKPIDTEEYWQLIRQRLYRND